MIAERDRQQHSQPRVPQLDNSSQSTIGLQPLDSLRSPLAATLDPAEVIFDGRSRSSSSLHNVETGIPNHPKEDGFYQALERELESGRPLSNQSVRFLFKQFTGCDLPDRTLPKHASLNFPKINAQDIFYALGGVFATRSARKEKHKKTIADFLRPWNEIPEGTLKKLIALAKTIDRKNATLMGGGLPPDELLDEMDKIFAKALQNLPKWRLDERRPTDQYPAGGGGAVIHREMAIQRYLGKQERDTLTQAHGKERATKGLWFTNGSQEALRLMCESLVKQYKPNRHKPIEIIITDSTYPGFLMAAEKFLESGQIKFRTVHIENDGSLNMEQLDDALTNSNRNHDNAKILYLAEGNPNPQHMANIAEVADLLKRKHGDALVVEDRAYYRLGKTNADALFYHIPEQVIAIETVSKMASPGLGLGMMYTAINVDRASLLQQTILHDQYNANLGVRGILTGTLYGILKEQHKEFEEHRRNVSKAYKEKRRIYKEAYTDALDTAYGKGNYNLDDKVHADIGMFGWRKTPVDSNTYAMAGAMLGLFSLPGSACTPDPKYVIGRANKHSDSFYHMRQNHTWDSERAIRIGIIKDVMLEVIFSEDLNPLQKRQSLLRLQGRARELNNGIRQREIDDFLMMLAKNNWQFDYSRLPKV